MTVAWLAGISRMHWWTFFVWNAAGGICWALLIGLIAYFFGHAAADAIQRYGLFGGLAIGALGVAALLGVHFWRKRFMQTETKES